MPVSEVSSPLLLQTIRWIETRSLDTAHRTMQNFGHVFRYAIASITFPEQIGALFRTIEGYKGKFITQSLGLGPLVFVRSGELRYADGSEINLAAGEWPIPSDK